jgi:hypothetical protein
VSGLGAPRQARLEEVEAECEDLRRHWRRQQLALDVKVILTPPCIFISDYLYRIYRVA